MAQTKMISKRYPCFRQQNVCHLGFQGGTKVAQVAHKVAQSRDQLLLSAKKSGQFSLGQSFITVDKVKTKRSVCGKGVLQGWLRFPRLGKIWSIFAWSTFYRRQSKTKRFGVRKRAYGRVLRDIKIFLFLRAQPFISESPIFYF